MDEVKTLQEMQKELEIQMTCPKHGVYIAHCFNFYGNEIKTNCPQCEQEATAAEIDAENKKAREKHVQELHAMNIEPKYYDKTLADYTPRNESQERAKSATQRLIAGELEKVILLGNNGLGKTLLGSIAVQATGAGAIYSAYEIGLLVRSTYNGLNNEYEQLDRLANLPILVIDEYEKSKNSEARQDMFSYIIDKRHARGLKTMILSEYHLRRSCKDGGCSRCFESLLTNDLVSRLRERGEIIELTGTDYRLEL